MADPNAFDVEFDRLIARVNSTDNLIGKAEALCESFEWLKLAKTNPRIRAGLKPHHIEHLRKAGEALKADGNPNPLAMLEFHLRALETAMPASAKLSFLVRQNPGTGTAPTIGR
jgi:hypothetical protein